MIPADCGLMAACTTDDSDLTFKVKYPVNIFFFLSMNTQDIHSFYIFVPGFLSLCTEAGQTAWPLSYWRGMVGRDLNDVSHNPLRAIISTQATLSARLEARGQ